MHSEPKRSVSIDNILSESWQKLTGNKLALNLALLIYVFAAAVVQGIVEAALPVTDDSSLSAMVINFLATVAGSGLTMVLFAGVLSMGIKVARGESVAVGEVFQHAGNIGPILLFSIAMTLLIYAGFLLLIIPGIYLSIAYGCALQVKAERDCGIWEALEISRRAITPVWWKVALLQFMLSLAMLGGLLTLLIGFIWLAPWVVICWGELYCRLFDEPDAVALENSADQFAAGDDRYSQQF